MSYDTLPIELLQLIFSFNTWSDHKTLSLVCRRWASAVEPMLLARTCLKVSYREVPMLYASIYYGNNYNEYHALSASIKIIDRRVLAETKRSYTCLRAEWGDERIEPNMRGLQEVLDECQKRFSLQKLYLKASPGKALTELFMKRRNWLENLTELHFEQCSTSKGQPVLLSAIELSLPKLKHLTWLECVGYEIYGSRYETSAIRSGRQGAIQEMPRVHDDINRMQATLDVPQLDRLKVRVKTRKEINWAELNSQPSGQEQPVPVDQYSLVLPSFNLKSCSKLQHIEMLELYDFGIFVNQRSIIQIGDGIYPNLKSLSFVNCTGLNMEKICEKCSQLEELFIDETSGSFSAQLPLIPLKKLTLKSSSPRFSNTELTFPDLRYLRLISTSYTLSPRNRVSLNAPQLTTIVAARFDYNLLTIAHKQQIRTMVVELNPFEMTDSPPPPNVTELFLCLRLGYGSFGEREIVEEYLQHYPNLRRLTIFAKEGPTIQGWVALSLQNFPNLEHLCANGVSLRLADFHGLTHLKSLILTDCLINAKTNDGEVILPTLEFIRLKYVHICDYTAEGHHSVDRTWDRFPICGSGWLQPPVIETSSSRSYSSPNFRPKRWDEAIPTE